MRIVAGEWRGRPLAAPPGAATRPTADRVRQAVFDSLAHAPWADPAGTSGWRGGQVLDAFAGTGAMGLEALSRGAAGACFLERDKAALAALRRNVAALGAAGRCRVVEGDATAPPGAAAPCALAFLDPPYGKGLVDAALAALGRRGWLGPRTLVVAEIGRDEPHPAGAPAPGAIRLDRRFGATRVLAWRAADATLP